MHDMLLGGQTHGKAPTTLPLPALSMHIGAATKVLGAEVKLASWQAATYPDGRIRLQLLFCLKLSLAGGHTLAHTLRRTHYLGRTMEFKSIALGHIHWTLNGRTLLVQPEIILAALSEPPARIAPPLDSGILFLGKQGFLSI